MNLSSKCHPNPGHFSPLLEVKAALIKMGECLPHFQLADKGSCSCNSQQQSRKSNLLVVSLFLCEVSELWFCRQDVGHNFYSASALWMFCSPNRLSSLLVLPEPHDYFTSLWLEKSCSHQRNPNTGEVQSVAYRVTHNTPSGAAVSKAGMRSSPS